MSDEERRHVKRNTIKKDNKGNFVLQHSDSSEEEEKARTPSGTIIENKVESIRTIFSPLKRCTRAVNIARSPDSQGNKVKVRSSLKRKVVKSGSVNSVHSWLITGKNNNSATDSDRQDSEVNMNDSITSKEDMEGIETSDMNDNALSHDSSSVKSDNEQDSILSEESKMLCHIASTLQEVNKKTKPDEKLQRQEEEENEDEDDIFKESSSVMHLESIDVPTDQKDLFVNHQQQSVMELNNDSNPQSVSVPILMEMFRQLRQDMKHEINSSLQLQRQQLIEDLKGYKRKCKEDAAKEVRKMLDEEQDKLLPIQKDIAYWKLKADNLSEICGRMHVEIQDLTTRVENLEVNNSKRMISITGLKLVGENKRDQIDYLAVFFENNLGLTVALEDCFTIGSNKKSPICVILQTMGDKRLIMSCKKLVKDVRGDFGKIYINDYLPPTTQEKRRRERDVIKMFTPQDPSDEMKVKYTKSGLQVHLLSVHDGNRVS